MRVDRGRIRLARGDVDGAVEDAERGLAAGRRAGDPQALLPAISYMAWVRIEQALPHEAEILVDELVQHGDAAEFVHAELAVSLNALGRQAALDQIVSSSGEVRWRDVLALIAAGSVGEAADLCEELVMLPVSAYLRIHAGERLIGEGRSAEAREHLARAIAFWRSVRATRFLQQAEGLVARLDAMSPGGGTVVVGVEPRPTGESPSS